MMDETSLFTLTYGLFIASVEEGGKKNGCVINTALQATSEPTQMTVTMIQGNLTTSMIKKKGSMTISVLSQDCPLDVINDFGMRSGRDYDKFDGVDHKIDGKGDPYLHKNTVAYMSLDVSSAIDLGTHCLFICDVIEARNIDKGRSMSYSDYRDLKKGKSIAKDDSKDSAESDKKIYTCKVCHYVYDGDTPFEELPDDYVCPVCKQPKTVFVAD